MQFSIGSILLFIIIALVQGRLAVTNLNTLNDIISSSQVGQFLTPDKLLQLHNEVFVTVVTSLSNQWDLSTLAQALQQLLLANIPQVSQMLVDWEAVAQSTLNDIGTAFPNVIKETLGGRFDKRDLSSNDMELLGQLPFDKLAQIADAVNIPDRRIALMRIRQILQESLPGYQGRDNFDDLAENILNHLDDLLPHLGQPTPPLQD